MLKTIYKKSLAVSASLLVCLGATQVNAACVDAVVLVHGNGGKPAQWDNTYKKLKSNGYKDADIYRPNWGKKLAITLNDHNGSEETPVRNAINQAVASSCTGKIDVIGHSMGVTLAAQQVIKTGHVGNVDAFVGIAGGYRGLLSCGIYPAILPQPTCGRHGVSIGSPFLKWLFGKKLGDRVYSIKSWVDQGICSTGTCLVYGKHSSQIEGEKASYTYAYGHLGLQKYTASKQYGLIK